MKKLLEKLFLDYHKDVYLYLYGLSRDVSLSEDLTSEVFLEAVKSIMTFRGKSDIKTWLFSIARHKWYHHLRKKKQTAESCIITEFISDGDNPEQIAVNNETAKRIYALLEKENKRTKEIVLMRLEGYSFYEIGKKYNISENSARVIDFRAKKKIQKILQEEGFVYE